MQRTGDTIAPSAFNSFIALSTSLRSKPESSAILPAFNGSPACFIVANTFSFASIMMSVLSVIIRYVQAANTCPARIAYSKLVIIPQITSNRHNVYFVGGYHSPHRERQDAFSWRCDFPGVALRLPRAKSRRHSPPGSRPIRTFAAACISRLPRRLRMAFGHTGVRTGREPSGSEVVAVGERSVTHG